MPGSEKKKPREVSPRKRLSWARSRSAFLAARSCDGASGFVEGTNSPMNEKQIAVEVQQDVNLRRGADLLSRARTPMQNA